MQITATAASRSVEIRFEGGEMVATISGKGGKVTLTDSRVRQQGEAPLLVDGCWFGGWVYRTSEGFEVHSPEEVREFPTLEQAVAYYAEGVLS